MIGGVHMVQEPMQRAERGNKNPFCEILTSISDLELMLLGCEPDLTNLPCATFDESLFANSSEVYMVYNDPTQTKTSNFPASLENYFSHWTPEIDSLLSTSFEDAKENGIRICILLIILTILFLAGMQIESVDDYLLKENVDSTPETDKEFALENHRAALKKHRAKKKMNETKLSDELDKANSDIQQLGLGIMSTEEHGKLIEELLNKSNTLSWMSIPACFERELKTINEKLDDISRTVIVPWEGKKTQKYHYENRKRKAAARVEELKAKKRKIIILKKKLEHIKTSVDNLKRQFAN